MHTNVIEKTAKYFKEKGVVLPTISELKNPHSISEDIKNKVLKLDKDAMDPANLFRVHWFNKRDHSKFLEVPEHIVLPSEFTGVDAKIIVNLGRYFPLITAHKVLAAYGCLLAKNFEWLHLIILNIKLFGPLQETTAEEALLFLKY
jgi:cysteine synthase A